MFDKMILSAAVTVGLLGSALPALAEYDYERYGGPHQTWCDVDPNCNGWNKGLHRQGYESSASGLVRPLDQKHRPSHKRSVAKDR